MIPLRKKEKKTHNKNKTSSPGGHILPPRKQKREEFSCSSAVNNRGPRPDRNKKRNRSEAEMKQAQEGNSRVRLEMTNKRAKTS